VLSHSRFIPNRTNILGTSPNLIRITTEPVVPKTRPSELFPKAVDGGDRSSGLSFAVDEHDAVDQLL
jgi:hypothetical protein